MDRDGYSVRCDSKEFLVSAHGEKLHSTPSMRCCGRWTESKILQSRARSKVVTSHVSGRTTARRDPNDCQRGRGCASRPTQSFLMQEFENLILCGESSTDGGWGIGGKPCLAWARFFQTLGRRQLENAIRKETHFTLQSCQKRMS